MPYMNKNYAKHNKFIKIRLLHPVYVLFSGVIKSLKYIIYKCRRLIQTVLIQVNFIPNESSENNVLKCIYSLENFCPDELFVLFFFVK